MYFSYIIKKFKVKLLSTFLGNLNTILTKVMAKPKERKSSEITFLFPT